MPIIYDLPFPDYLSDPGIGSHAAAYGLNSLQMVRDALDGLLDRESPALQVGTIAHMAVLEPERFEKCKRSVGPINPKTGSPYGRDTKAFAEWQEQNPDVIMVDAWIYRAIERMPPEVREIMSTGGHSEVSAFVDMPWLNMRVKCRCDRLRGTMISDLKSIAVATDHAIDREISRRLYWFTNAWYRMVMKAATGHKHGHELVFVEKAPPHRWRIRELDADAIGRADDRLDAVLTNISEAIRSGDWSDRGDIQGLWSFPAWEADDDEPDEGNDP